MGKNLWNSTKYGACLSLSPQIPPADTHVERQTSWPISAYHSRLSGVSRNLRLKPRGLLASSYHQRRPFEDFCRDSQYLHRMYRPRQD
jgi:hypothetical protein